MILERFSLSERDIRELVKTYERRVLSLRYSTGPGGSFSDREFILGKIFHGENLQVRKMHFLCQNESLLRVLMALLEIL